MAQKVRLVVWFDNDMLLPIQAMQRLGDIGKSIVNSGLTYNPKFIVADVETIAQADLTLEDVVGIYNKEPFDAFTVFGGGMPLDQRD